MTAVSADGDRGDHGPERLPARSPGRPLDPVRASDDLAELAATGGALVAALLGQRWNEAHRSWLQRRIGAAPFRQGREELTVRAGALLGGTLTYLLAVGATDGLHRLRDARQRRETARTVSQILGAAATGPDGSMPDEARFIVETALMGLGVGARARQRLLAEPRPASIGDLGACPLPEPLLSAVAVIAFSAMAEATGPDEAFRATPVLLRRLGLARPAAEAKAEEIRADYNGSYLVLTDFAARLRPPTPPRSRRLRPPVAALAAAGAAVQRNNPSEVDRQLTRQTIVTLLRYGTRATVNAGRPMPAAVLTAVRLVGHVLGEEMPPRPAAPTHAELDE